MSYSPAEKLAAAVALAKSFGLVNVTVATEEVDFVITKLADQERAMREVADELAELGKIIGDSASIVYGGRVLGIAAKLREWRE